jgi:hypothetical protein
VWCDAKGLRRLTIPDQLKMATAYCANGRSSWYSGGGDSACTYIAHPLPDVLLCKLHYCSCNLAAPSLNYPSISISISIAPSSCGSGGYLPVGVHELTSY